MTAKAHFLLPRAVLATTLFTAFSRLPSSTALLVAPNSPCAYHCGNVLTSTSITDLVCSDSDFASTQTGQTVTACLNCELSSTYVDSSSNISDLQALLYNIRYTASACLWNEPAGIGLGDNQCITGFACGPELEPVQYDNLSVTSTTFGYCSEWNDYNIGKCESCVQSLGNRFFLSNFFTTLDAACIQKPAQGSTIALTGSLFATTAIAISTPTSTSSGSAYVPPSTSGLSLGAKVGIAVGAIVGLLILTGCSIICIFKRKRRAHLRALEKNAIERGPAMSYFRRPQNDDNSPQDTLNSQRRFIPVAPLTTNMAWQKPGQQHYNDSPVSNLGEQIGFSPYVSPVSPPNAREWNIPITLGDDKGKKPAAHVTISPADSIEMQNLAAVLPMAPMAKGEKVYDTVAVPMPYSSPPPTKTSFGHPPGGFREDES